jgi:LmbE family N-acetylglucosaminyl deacetylase
MSSRAVLAAISGNESADTSALARLCGVVGEQPEGVLFVVAHPDDVVVAAGARIGYVASLTILHVTDGTPRTLNTAQKAAFNNRKLFALTRRAELKSALELITGKSRLHSLPIAEQEACYHIADIARWIVQLARKGQVAMLVTQPYEGGHPDHDACAVACRCAVELLKREEVNLPLLEVSGYHFDGARMRGGAFIPRIGVPAARVPLALQDRNRKLAMLDCFQSQPATLELLPLRAERFRVAPGYNFNAAPHAGPVLYELLESGMSSERWRALARDAIRELESEAA